MRPGSTTFREISESGWFPFFLEHLPVGKVGILAGVTRARTDHGRLSCRSSIIAARHSALVPPSPMFWRHRRGCSSGRRNYGARQPSSTASSHFLRRSAGRSMLRRYWLRASFPICFPTSGLLSGSRSPVGLLRRRPGSVVHARRAGKRHTGHVAAGSDTGGFRSGTPQMGDRSHGCCGAEGPRLRFDLSRPAGTAAGQRLERDEKMRFC